MRRLLIVIAAAALATGAAAQVSIAQAPEQPGTLLAEGLTFSIGSAVDAECNVYVAEGASATEFAGQITMIDGSTGEKTTLASGIAATDLEGAAFGAIDVTLLDGDVYYLLTGQEDNGVYRVEDDGSSTLIANIGAFNVANPVTFPDALPTGNPYSINPYDGGFLVADGNFNRLLKVGLDGTIEILASFDNVVPTGTTISPDGHIVWAQIGPFPHSPEDGKVLRLDGGSATTLASGLANVIDVAFGDDGTLYALNMGDSDTTGEAPAVPFTGKISIVNADGTLSPVVDGFMFATSLELCGGDAYVTGLSGEVRVIADIDSLEPLPEPTVEPTATIVPPAPPATGTGTAAEGEAIAYWLALLGLAVTAAGAGMLAARHRG